MQQQTQNDIKTAVQQYIDEPTTHKERGEAIFSTIMTHIKAVNKVNGEYKNSLAMLLEKLTVATERRNALRDKINLSRVRKTLDNV